MKKFIQKYQIYSGLAWSGKNKSLILGRWPETITPMNRKLLLALRILFWISLTATLIVFYYSLRQTESGFKATLLSLGLWALTYAIHLGIKRIRKKGERSI